MKAPIFENLSLAELKDLKKMIEADLAGKYKYVIEVRGYDYSELCRRELVYNKDDNHRKLKKINDRIKQFLTAI